MWWSKTVTAVAVDLTSIGLAAATMCTCRGKRTKPTPVGKRTGRRHPEKQEARAFIMIRTEAVPEIPLRFYSFFTQAMIACVGDGRRTYKYSSSSTFLRWSRSV
jgi:hypothetical protein